MSGSTWSWVGKSSTAWANSSNWTLVTGSAGTGVPAAGDTALIESTAPNTLTLIDLELNSNTIDVSGGASIDFTNGSALDGKVVNGSTVYSTVNVSSGTIGVSGLFTDLGDIEVIGSTGVATIAMTSDGTLISDANSPGGLDIGINIGAPGTTNNGSLIVSGGTLENQAIHINGGTASISSIFAPDVVNGTTLNNLISITGGMLDMTQSGTGSPTIAFVGGPSASSTARFENPGSFTGSISGFASNDILDIGSNTVGTLVYTPNTGFGTLTLEDAGGSTIFSTVMAGGDTGSFSSTTTSISATGTTTAGSFKVIQGSGDTLITEASTPAPPPPPAFVAGKNTLSSGTGAWTLTIPSDATIAIDDPPTRPPIPPSGQVPPQDLAQFPSVKLVIDLKNDQPSTVSILGDASTQFPDPPDSVGFTANFEIDVINDTGHKLQDVAFALANTSPDLPYNLVPGVIEYGETVNANYAYFTDIRPVDGETTTLFDPTGQATTPSGAAAAMIVVSGVIDPGATVTSFSIVHNTELSTNINDFKLTVADTPAPPPPPSPSQIVLQNGDGSVASWRIEGLTLTGGSMVGPNPGPSWSLVGTGAFFAGDGDDYLWRNADGSVAIWQVSGTTVGDQSALVAANPGTSWYIGATGDFYHDGHTAIAWQYQDGSVALWDMNGATISQFGIVVANPGPEWHIKGSGDFYGNGHTDLLWQNDDGSVALWDMDGTTISQSGEVAANPGPSWHIKGTGDFYGNGHTDILWQHDDGTVALWDMHGTTISQAGMVADPGPGWHVVGTGDFNADAKTDIVLRNDDGSIAVWDMNNTSIVSAAVLANPGQSWNVVGSDGMRFIYPDASGSPLEATPLVADQFVLNQAPAGTQTISGFDPLQDFLELSRAQFASFADVQAASTGAAGGTLITLDQNSSVLLSGVDPSSLHASNFALVSTA
jgi:hypothetical protein